MHDILYEYEDLEGNNYYIAMVHKAKHCIGGANFGPPCLHWLLTGVSRTGGFLSCISSSRSGGITTSSLWTARTRPVAAQLANPLLMLCLA